jgi:hypothetical protein
MLGHFVWWTFLLGIVVGVISVYYVTPAMSTVIKYPTPQEVDKLIYKDKNGVCYQYTTKEVNCDANEARLRSFPLL